MPDRNDDHHSAPGYLVHLAHRRFARSIDRELKPLGVTLAQLYPLFVLEDEGPMLQRDLVRRSATGQPAMVDTLVRLERDGFVERRRDERDRRAAAIDLTDKGRATVKAAGIALVEGNEKAMVGFDPEERQTLVTLLLRMASNLGDDPEPEA